MVVYGWMMDVRGRDMGRVEEWACMGDEGWVTCLAYVIFEV